MAEKKEKLPKKIDLAFGKTGILIWMDKSGRLIMGLKKVHFLKEKDTKENLSQYYKYQSEVCLLKAEEVLKVMTPEEKLDSQIAKLVAKKEALKK